MLQQGTGQQKAPQNAGANGGPNGLPNGHAGPDLDMEDVNGDGMNGDEH